MGKHVADLGEHDRYKAHVYQVLAGIPNLISITAAKISISTFLIHMLGPAITISQLYFLRTLMALAVVLNAAGMVVAINIGMTPPEALDAGSLGYFWNN